MIPLARGEGFTREARHTKKQRAYTRCLNNLNCPNYPMNLTLTSQLQTLTDPLPLHVLSLSS
jgi:hypothetical protein